MSEQTSSNRGNGGNIADMAANVVAENAPDPAQTINAGFEGAPSLYINQAVVYKFKSPRKDKDGNPPTDELGQPIAARAPVSLTIPVPTWEALKKLTEEEKGKNWVLDIIHDVVKQAVHDQVYDEANPVNSQDELKLDVLSLDYLVDVPKTERTGRGIPKEVWDEWVKDYKDVMSQVGTRSPDKIGNAADVFMKKFNPIKTNKKVVEFLLNELDSWAEYGNLEEYQGIYDFLKRRGNDLIKLDPEKQMSDFQ